MSNESVATPPPAAGEDKTVAILSYITIFGFIVAIILNSSKKTVLGAFHLRQALGLFIAGIGIWIALVIVMVILGLLLGLVGLGVVAVGLGTILYVVVGLSLFALFVMGLISAIQGTMKPVPVIGEKIQSILKGVFN